jgi:hypothetical protein
LSPSDCSAVASQAFDAAHMQPYTLAPDVSNAVALTLSHMGPAEKASQMVGLPAVGVDIDFLDRKTRR